MSAPETSRRNPQGNVWSKPICTWLFPSPNDIETIAFNFLDLIVKGNDALMGTVQAFEGEGSFPLYAAPHIERAIADSASSDGNDGIQPQHINRDGRQGAGVVVRDGA